MVKKTLFREMFIYNIMIVILAMSLTAIVLYTQLGAYFKSSIYKTLDSRAEQVSKMSGYLIDAGGGMEHAIGLREIMSLIGNDEGQGFIITDVKGNIIVGAGFNERQLKKSSVSPEAILDSVGGETVAREGDLGGALDKKFLYVTTPLWTRRGIEGAVIVCSTVPYIQNMQLGVMKMFFFAVVFVIMLTLLVAAWFSQRIAKPVKEMTLVARKIASGDFTQRVSRDAEGELGLLAASFNQMTVALGEMDEVQSSFISDVSHELRTPMTIISGFVEGVLDGTIPEEEHKKYLEIVLSEIKRLNRLVNDLLEMSRLNSGKIEYKMVPFDITESVRKAIVAFEQGISEKKIDMEVDFESDAMSVVGNSDSVYRVITNLMDNAVKFTPEGGRIAIKIKNLSGKTKVSIENSGNGLSEKELNHIWDRFYQTDKSRSSAKRGAGLGLYIVKNIMKAHDNEIYAESEEGSWTRFTFELDSVKNK